VCGIGIRRPTCTKYGQSILRKISKIAATRCHLLRLKCTKFDFEFNPAGGAYSAPTGPLARFEGPTSEGKERGREDREGEEVCSRNFQLS